MSTLSTGSTMLDAVQEEDAETNMNMHESYVLSQPISAVTLMDSENKILTGTVDGMVQQLHVCAYVRMHILEYTVLMTLCTL